MHDQDTVVVVAAVDVPFQYPLSSPVGKGDLHQDHTVAAATDAAVVAATVARPVVVEISLVLLPRCQGSPSPNNSWLRELMMRCYSSPRHNARPPPRMGWSPLQWRSPQISHPLRLSSGWCSPHSLRLWTKTLSLLLLLLLMSPSSPPCHPLLGRGTSTRTTTLLLLMLLL